MKGRWRLAVAVSVLGFLCIAIVQHGFLGGLARSGGAPTQSTPGDLDADGRLTVGDAIYLVNFLFLGGPPPAACGSATATDTTTIIVVRHAEKATEVDPGLTETGQMRALRLVDALRDVVPDLLVTSTLRRTVETLGPLAKFHAMPTEMIDRPDDVVERLKLLAPGSNAIVAHHSFTIRPILLGLGLQPEDIEGISLGEFDNLFVVTCNAADSTVDITRLRYASDLNGLDDPPKKEEEDEP